MEEVLRRLDELEAKLDTVARSAECTRRYILWMLIASLAFVLLPIIILLFMLPAMISSMNAQLEGLL